MPLLRSNIVIVRNKLRVCLIREGLLILATERENIMIIKAAAEWHFVVSVSLLIFAEERSCLNSIVRFLRTKMADKPGINLFYAFILLILRCRHLHLHSKDIEFLAMALGMTPLVHWKRTTRVRVENVGFHFSPIRSLSEVREVWGESSSTHTACLKSQSYI